MKHSMSQLKLEVPDDDTVNRFGKGEVEIPASLSNLYDNHSTTKTKTVEPIAVDVAVDVVVIELAPIVEEDEESEDEGLSSPLAGSSRGEKKMSCDEGSDTPVLAASKEDNMVDDREDEKPVVVTSDKSPGGDKSDVETVESK